MKPLGISVLVCVIASLAAGFARGDWSRFRGANGSGVSDTTGLPLIFGPDKNLIWRVPLPTGHSSPVIAGDRLYLTANTEDALFTYCLEIESGRILWRREAPRPRKEPFHEMHGPASPSPVTDGSNVYVFFGDFGLLSYGPDGNERWRLPLGPFKTPNGHGTSPILVEGLLILLNDQDTAACLLAIDTDSGSVVWRAERPEAAHGYSTPTVYRPPGEPAQIVVAGSYQLTSYSIEKGKKLWWVRGLTWQLKPSPVVERDTIFVTGWAPGADDIDRLSLPAFQDAIAAGDADHDKKISEPEAIDRNWRHKGGWGLVDMDGDGSLNEREWNFLKARLSAHNVTMAIQPGSRRGDLTQSAISWTYTRAVPVVSSPLYYQGILYTIKDGGILTSLNAETGEMLKQGRLSGAIEKYMASPVAGDNKIYIAGETGKIVVVSPGAQWEVLQINDLGAPVYATPAIGDRRLFVRTVDALFAFGSSSD